MSVQLRPETGPTEDAEALFREARQRRRRRWLLTAAVVLVATTLSAGGLWIAGDGNGGGRTRPTHVGHGGAASAATDARQQETTPPATAVHLNTTVSIDFLDSNVGWIATGGACSTTSCPLNPTIIQTEDGGKTWRQLHVPNMAGGVNPLAWRAYGGLIGIHFADPLHGWYYQSGELWGTNDGGTTWRSESLGGVTALVSTGRQVWAVGSKCSSYALSNSCPISSVRRDLYRKTVGSSTWHLAARLPVGEPSPTLDPGITYLVPDGSSVIALDSSGKISRVDSAGRLVQLPTSCFPFGFHGSELVGICNGGGGGDASVTTYARSSDDGNTWTQILGGPPVDQYWGLNTTNGAGALFVVTGDSTLWRADTNSPTPEWQPVLSAPNPSIGGFTLVYFQDPRDGWAVTSGPDAQVFASHDGGVTWVPATITAS